MAVLYTNYSAARCRCIVQISAFSLLLAIVPIAAHANIVFPSVVQWLSAAGPYSILLLPIVLTFPLLLAISTIEAFITRAVLKPIKGIARLILNIFWINAFTSAIGLITMPNGTELFPGIPLAFLATTMIEGICLVIIYPKGKRRLHLNLFKASALMNGASYTFLGLILFLLIYLPSALMPNNLSKKELTGQLVITNYQGVPVLSINPSTGKITHEVQPKIDANSPYKVVFIDGNRWIVSTADKRRVGIIPGSHYSDGWQVANNGIYYANYLANSDAVVVGNLKANKQKRFRNIDQMLLCPATGKVALLTERNLRVYDPASNKVKSFKLHGVYLLLFSDLAWSPDGKYIAYSAICSPFTQMVGEYYPDAIRVVSLDGREATVVREIDASISWDEIYWLPELKQ